MRSCGCGHDPRFARRVVRKTSGGLRPPSLIGPWLARPPRSSAHCPLGWCRAWLRANGREALFPGVSVPQVRRLAPVTCKGGPGRSKCSFGCSSSSFCQTFVQTAPSCENPANSSENTSLNQTRPKMGGGDSAAVAVVDIHAEVVDSLLKAMGYDQKYQEMCDAKAGKLAKKAWEKQTN